MKTLCWIAPNATPNRSLCCPSEGADDEPPFLAHARWSRFRDPKRNLMIFIVTAESQSQDASK
jgi:hypothetical protein